MKFKFKPDLDGKLTFTDEFFYALCNGYIPVEDILDPEQAQAVREAQRLLESLEQALREHPSYEEH